MDADERKWLDDLSSTVIGASYEVSNSLGPGFLEKVYENALKVELESRGVRAETQKKMTVRYKGVVVGDYLADMVVEDRLIVELKCAATIAPEHVAQCLNYLKATGVALGLILNFQKPKVQIKRVVHNF